MRLCVFGAGAVGGYLAARLLASRQHEVSVVARGEQLRAIAAGGITLVTPEETLVVRPALVTDRAQALPPQDVVFVTLKAHSQPAAAQDMAALLGPAGTAVFLNNGIPWWWHHRGPAVPGEPLPLLDPTGALWNAVRPQRALGGVVYSANEVLRPGVVQHTANNRWVLGEPGGGLSQRLRVITGLLCGAGLNAEAGPDIRTEVWAKLLRNAPMNALCALTRLPVNQLAFEPALLGMYEAVIDEVAAVAAAHGADLSDRIAVAKSAPRLGAAVDGRAAPVIRPSMLQDTVLRRGMEIEPILGQVQAFARAAGTACPVLDLLLPLLRGLDRSAGFTAACARP
ncbi:2-dehydropantoate 2-reductase [Hydrogenophaga taeniospiralis]|uniref:ketopantoate reductase family protein n=1 Tax=Hydrogenophaga taeniospiralis TaxID=65656 RepID=UPI001CFB175F|nr:2-dehydropantoate 2-reductase [Hydrogenophaga taeniospiralis]MCB4365512.1 2-dehydropantoate 2-reductase [Hydrogenophaga taeniospiralis]